MSRHFLVVWSVYWALLAVLPVRSIYPATMESMLLQMAFVALVLLVIQIAEFVLASRQLPPAGAHDLPYAAVLVKWALAMSLVGVTCLIIDKVFIQHIDYSEGIAVAREQWRRLGDEREGSVSSIFSVLGYLFGSAYFVALVLAVTQTKALAPSQRIWTMFACLMLMMLNSLITGGRSNVLLVLTFVFAAMASRRGLGLRTILGPRLGVQMLLLMVALSTVAYSIFVFYQRAEAGGERSTAYVLEFLPYLGLEAASWYRDLLGDDILSSFSAMSILAVSYVTHSFASTAAIIDGPSEDKTLILIHVFTILSRLGIGANPDGDWFLAGRLPSLPGALWHQFGAFGFVIGSMSLGVLCAVAKTWTARKPRRLLPLGVFAMSYVILILSPALFAGDFLSFPFVGSSFVMLAIIDWLVRHTTVWRGAGPDEAPRAT
jgi:hypothetical protein